MDPKVPQNQQSGGAPEAVSREEFQESIRTLMKSVPPPIRAFLASDERDSFILGLSKKYGFRVDQAGEFEKALTFMLLGVYEPNEFIQSLQESGVSPENIEALLKDLNEQLFARLRKEEEAASTPAPQAKSGPLVPPPAITMQAPAPRPQPASAAPAPVPLAQPAPTVPAAPAPLPKPISSPAPTPARSTINSVPQSRPPAAPAPAKPAALAVPNPAREDLHNVLKSYGIDPYREAPE